MNAVEKIGQAEKQRKEKETETAHRGCDRGEGVRVWKCSLIVHTSMSVDEQREQSFPHSRTRASITMTNRLFNTLIYIYDNTSKEGRKKIKHIEQQQIHNTQEEQTRKGF